jgi:DNA-binding phage protein
MLAAIVGEREGGLAQLLREHGVTRQKVAKALKSRSRSG